MATLAALPLDAHTLAAASCVVALAALIVSLLTFAGTRTLERRVTDLERRQPWLR